MPLSWGQLASLIGPPGPMQPLVAWLANPQANDRRILLRATQAPTISRIDAVLSGGTNPTVGFALRHGPDVAAAGTAVTADPIPVTSTTTGNTLSSLENPEILPGHWLWLEVTAMSGSPTGLMVSIELQ